MSARDSSDSSSFGLSWVFCLPPALQVAAQITGGFLIPGALGFLVKYWTELTHWFWARIAGLIDLDIRGIESLFDGPSLALLLLTSALGARFRARRRPSELEPLAWSGWRHTLKLSSYVATFVVAFSFGGLSAYATTVSPEDAVHVGGLAVNVHAARLAVAGFFVTLVLVTGLLALYLRYDRERLVQRHDAHRREGRRLRATAMVAPGLLVRSYGFTAPALILFAAIFRPQLEVEGLRQTILSSVAITWLAFLVLIWACHRFLGRPGAAKLIGDVEFLVPLGAVLLLMYTAFLPFALHATVTESEVPSSIKGGLMMGSAAALLGAFLLVLKTNWMLLRNILVCAGVLIGVDQLFGWAARALS